MTDLQNAIALVTGASRGLGRAIAVGLAEIGVDVVVNYRAREDEAQACADEIRRRARRAAVVRADVSRVDEARHSLRARWPMRCPPLSKKPRPPPTPRLSSDASVWNLVLSAP